MSIAQRKRTVLPPQHKTVFSVPALFVVLCSSCQTDTALFWESPNKLKRLWLSFDSSNVQSSKTNQSIFSSNFSISARITQSNRPDPKSYLALPLCSLTWRLPPSSDLGLHATHPVSNLIKRSLIFCDQDTKWLSWVFATQEKKTERDLKCVPDQGSALVTSALQLANTARALSSPDPMNHVKIFKGPPEMPLRNGYNCGTKHFHLIILIRWKWKISWVE